MINEEVYQIIFDELSQYLLPYWEKLIVYLEYGNNSYTFSFYVKDEHRIVKCFDLPGVTEEALASSFKKIDIIVSKERRNEKGNLWSNITMTVMNTGDMHADYDYSDLSEGTYEYKKEWKKKYLN